MRESTSFAKFIFTILTALLLVTLSILLVQKVWEGQTNPLQTLVTPTATPKVDFVLEIPQKALWKNYFIVSASVAPGITCDLLYIPPSGATQELSSMADENGKCTWRWKIEETDGKGNGRLIITIGGMSETHFIEIRSSF